MMLCLPCRVLSKCHKFLVWYWWRSAGTSRLVVRLVPSVRLSTVGSRAFPVAAPRIWNALPEETSSAQSLTSFRQHLKTWLFRQSYPDLIIWSVLYRLPNCFNTISVEVAMLLRASWLTVWLILDQELIPYRYSLCCCCSPFWGDFLRKSLRSVVSNRIGMKFGKVVQVNVCRLTVSDFWYDVILSR